MFPLVFRDGLGLVDVQNERKGDLGGWMKVRIECCEGGQEKGDGGLLGSQGEGERRWIWED